MSPPDRSRRITGPWLATWLERQPARMAALRKRIAQCEKRIGELPPVPATPPQKRTRTLWEGRLRYARGQLALEQGVIDGTHALALIDAFGGVAEILPVEQVE